MKKLFLIVFFVSATYISAQETPYDYSKTFKNELKDWTSSFKDFDLKDFKLSEEIKFKSTYFLDKNLDSLSNIDKEIGVFSPNKTMFVDLFSSFNIEKKGKGYEANGEPDQHLDVLFLEEEKCIRMYSTGSSAGLDEVCWVSENKLIVTGYMKDIDVKKPLVILVDYLAKKISVFENFKASQTKNHIPTNLKKFNLK
jgi:hypothetical protein